MKRKKLLLLISLVAMLLWLPGKAQVPIGSQDGTTTNMPIFSCYDYSYTQQLIYQEEINAEGEINTISFFYSDGDNENSDDWTVYLGHTEKTEFESTTDWVPISELTEVYNGTVTFPDEGSEMVVTFETPFVYNNTDNLVLAVDQNKPGYNCNIYFGRTASYSKSRGIYYRSDSDNPDPASPPEANARVNYINNVVLGGIEQSCLPPTDLSVDNLTSTTADISWIAGEDEAEWKVKYGEYGFDPLTEGISESVSGSPNTTLSNLNVGTTYNFYIKAHCGEGDESSFSFSGTFTTDCDVVSEFTESFDTTPSGEVPNCWSTQKVNSTDSFIDFNVKYNANAVSSPNVFEFFNAGDNLAEFYLISPELTNLNDADNQLRFFFQGPATPGEATLEIGTMSDPSDVSTYSSVESVSVTSDFEEYTVAFDQNYEDDAYVVFKVKFSINYIKVYLDNVNWEPLPSCNEPSNLTVNYDTDTSVQVFWDANSQETEWEVSYGELGFDPAEEGTIVIVEDNPETILENLNPDTNYEVYVRAICGEGEKSVFSEPISFITGVAPPENNFMCDAIPLTTNDNCADGAYTNVGAFEELDEPVGSCLTNFHGNNTVWFSFVGPMNAEATITTDFPSTEFSTEIVVFEAPTDCEDVTSLGEEVGCASSSDDVELTNLTPGAIYYVKVAGFNNAEGNFCIEIQTDGTAFCPAPSDIIVEVGEQSVDVSWTPGGDEDQWTVIYGEAGFNPQVDGETIIVNDTPETILTNLEPETDYNVYVMAMCDGDSPSGLVGPKTFNSGDMSIEDYLFEDFTYYPNPIKDQLTLKAGTQIESVSVYNLLGQTVLIENPNQLETQLNTESLQAGVYLMKVSLNGNTKIVRIIKK